VKKAEIRTMLQNIDKETAATITFDEFLEMATPKVQNRDEREEIMKASLFVGRERGGQGVGAVVWPMCRRARKSCASRQRLPLYLLLSLHRSSPCLTMTTPGPFPSAT
jgi:hypothetical protein